MMKLARVLALTLICVILPACTPGSTNVQTAFAAQPTRDYYQLPPDTSRGATGAPIQTFPAPATSRTVYIPAGAFQMGGGQEVNANPVHAVMLSHFLMDRYEVTNADYAECVTATKCPAPPQKSSETRADYYTNSKYARYPVVNVTWNEADAYCRWRGGRLPTEAEWERAARGGVEGKLFPWGDNAAVCIYGATNGAQIYNCPIKDTTAVGTFAANAYGLFDMSGNVWEWVSDWYNVNYYGTSIGSNNPTGPVGGEFKILRGGGWFPPQEMTIAYRYYVTPTIRYNFVGFRCVIPIP
jgi:formylglycine-generating enzyme required for sulfatase activity